MQRRGSAGSVRSLWLSSLLLVSLASCDDKPAREPQVELSGRGFAAETGKAVGNVLVRMHGGATAPSGGDGSFKLRYGEKRDSAPLASAPAAAPLRKPAPEA